MRTLPSLRRKIRRSFSVLTALHAVLGVLLVIAVSIASRNTPKAIHMNYDSISATLRMEQAWNALRAPREFPEKTPDEWKRQFEAALRFEEGNVTEPGEESLAKDIRGLWDRSKTEVETLDQAEAGRMRDFFLKMIEINESGMFQLADQNTRLSQGVLIGAVLFFLASLVLSIFFGDSLASRLSDPLKSIAELLQSNPPLNRRLRLPEPATLELLVLNQQLDQLWERLRRMEQLNYTELLKQKSKLEVLFQSVEDAVLVVEGTGEVAQCSGLMVELIGLPDQEIVGHFWKDLPTSNDNYLKLRNVLAEEIHSGTEIDLVQNGQKRNFAIRSRQITRPGWSHSGTLYLLHDITEKRQRDRLRTELIDLLSHELKTPLQSLGTASDLLQQERDKLPSDIRLLADTVSEDVERIKAVANEFVQVTQTHAKVMKLKMEKVAVNQVIEDWLKPFRIVAKDRDIRVETVHEGSEVIYANIDTVKFPWVISNLVSNAIRFSPRGGVVTVKLTDRNGAVEIKVKDQGPGIPFDDRQRIFEPFYQAKIPTADGTRGLFGVGLTIAKEVVEAHDGRLEYCPNEPRGSVFRILLPFPALDLG